MDVEIPFLRPVDGRMVGGVCAAIARRLRIDVTLVRTAFGLTALAFGLGIVVYAIAWIVIPQE